MPVILVIIIMVAWVVILGPNLLKRRSRTVGGINSISHFHRQLPRARALRVPSPLVTPAYRLRSVDGAGALRSTGDGDEVRVTPKLSVVGADQLPRPPWPSWASLPRTPGRRGPRRFRPLPADARPTLGGDTPAPAQSRPVNRVPDGYARAQARRRRRDTLGVLSLVFVGTLMIGFVPGAAVAWALTLASGLALAAYVALLVRMRQMAEERERKLHYLRPAVDDTEGVGAGPLGISGRYAHPSNQMAIAH